MKEKKDPGKYPIGYKKPPQHSRFKPGQSGNPKGRPRKAPTLPDTLLKELQTRVTITRNGKKKTISILEAIVTQLLAKAANGDAKATALLFKALNQEPLGSGDNLGELVQEFRAVYARSVARTEDSGQKADEPRP